jgi:hypothetical protein
VIKNELEVLRSHASDYRTPFDAFYEYVKNLEEAPAMAKNIHVELLHDKHVILIYGDGRGMGVPELMQMQKDTIGESSKGPTHHGLGILSFLRFAKKMTIVSRKNGKLYILSCDGSGEDGDKRLVSDSGDPREVTNEDSEYECYYRKLRSLGDAVDGTITVLEGVGQFSSNRFDWKFDMKEEFEARKFVKELQKKLFFNLAYRNYTLKIEGGTEKKYKKKEKIPAKLGTGKQYDFTIPSAKYPAEGIPGQRHDCFDYSGRQFTLKVKFTFFVGPSNDGNIQVSENHENGLPLREAIKIKLSKDSVFKNPDYAPYLNGLVDFKITPLDGGDGINVYSGTRSALLIDGSFGDCLCNIITYADEEIIRPAIGRIEKKSDAFQDDMRSQNLQKDMEMLFHDMPWLAEKVMLPKHTGPVVAAGMVRCKKCGLTVLPMRGVNPRDYKPEGNKIYDHNMIYAFEDKAVYKCGCCGTTWDRQIHTEKTDPPTRPPIYVEPKPTEGVPRQRLRGCGFSYKLQPFDRDDERRSMVFGTVVKINRIHPDWQSINKDRKHKELLPVYERLIAMEAIINHTMAEVHRDDYAETLQTALASTLVWFGTMRQKLSSEEIDRLHEGDASQAA